MTSRARWLLVAVVAAVVVVGVLASRDAPPAIEIVERDLIAETNELVSLLGLDPGEDLFEPERVTRGCDPGAAAEIYFELHGETGLNPLRAANHLQIGDDADDFHILEGPDFVSLGVSRSDGSLIFILYEYSDGHLLFQTMSRCVL